MLGILLTGRVTKADKDPNKFDPIPTYRGIPFGCSLQATLDILINHDEDCKYFKKVSPSGRIIYVTIRNYTKINNDPVDVRFAFVDDVLYSVTLSFPDLSELEDTSTVISGFKKTDKMLIAKYGKPKKYNYWFWDDYSAIDLYSTREDLDIAVCRGHLRCVSGWDKKINRPEGKNDFMIMHTTFGVYPDPGIRQTIWYCYAEQELDKKWEDAVAEDKKIKAEQESSNL